jgi:hypothetical protein
VYKTLEHGEHATHIAHEQHGHHEDQTGKRLFSAQIAALVVATLAAGLALSEQGAKHAEIRVQENLVDATDAWAQYQAKSTRSALSRDVVQLIDLLGPAADPELSARRNRAMETLKADEDRYINDPHDGMKAIAQRAHDFEHARDHALEQTHAYHNGSAAMELGIVLATASAVIGSRLLLGIAGVVGLIGAWCAGAGYLAPALGTF